MLNDRIGASTLTIEGNTYEEIKKVLYSRYGTGYEIIDHQTKLKGGFLGFGQKSYVEAKFIVRNPMNAIAKSMNEQEELVKNRDELVKKFDAPASTSQIARLSKQIEQLQSQMEEGFGKVNTVQATPEKPEAICKIEEILADNEFTPAYIENMTAKIRKEFSIEELEDYEKVEAQVVDWIGETLKISDNPHFRPPHVVVIIGPTGVGKTTTIAKLSASLIKSARSANKDVPVVRLLTTDSMRVGAQAQLDGYGSIMEINVDKAENVDDLKKLFQRYKSNSDYIFIDTSGFSPNDYENIAKMRGLFDIPSLKPDIYLAVMASTKAKDLERIFRNYEQFDFRSVIITKCDETSCIGNVLSVLSQKQKPISWITNGQQVPRNIEKATRVGLLKYLDGFKIDREHLEEKFPDIKE